LLRSAAPFTLGALADSRDTELRGTGSPWVWPAVLAIASVCTFATDGLFRWVAVALVIIAVTHVWPTIRVRLAASPSAQMWPARLPIAVLVGLAGWMLLPLVGGEPPASRDHAIHYFQARILVDEMLPSGRLSGWTESFNHGFPFGEGYPSLGVLWVSAAHLLSFGVIDLRTSYAWGLLAVWALSLWGVWRIAAAIATDVRARRDDTAKDDDVMSRWAGCAGAFAWLLDPGTARQGGWSYLMFHGVWPQQLSTALWIAALVWMLRALRSPTPRNLAIAAILLAGSLLAHPFGLLTAAGSAVAIIVVAITADDVRAWPSGRVRIVLAMHGLAIALAVAGMATFLAASSELGRSPVAWSELGELAVRLATGDLLAGPWAWSGALVVVGLALALWTGRASAWLVAGLCCGMLLLGSREAITTLRLDLVASGFKNLQFPRFAIAVKPLAFALAGAALAVVGRALFGALASAKPMLGTRHRFVIAIVIAPAVSAMLGRADLFARRPVASIDTLAGSELAHAEQALRDALVAEREHTAHMRVAFLRSEMGGGTYPLFAIADAGADAVLDGHVATVNFDHLIERRTPSVLRRIGVTHVIHDRPLGDNDAELAAVIEPIGTYGPYELARLGVEPDTAPRLLDGDGTVVEIEHTAERRLFDVETTGATLELAQAPSDRWQWSLDGEPLESTFTTVRGGIELLAVELPRGGRVMLEYVTRPSERWGRWISLGALVIALVMLVGTRPLQLAERLHSEAALKIIRISFALGAVMLLVLIARRQATQLAVTWHEYADRRVFTSRRGGFAEPPPFARELSNDAGITITRAARPVCDGILGKDALVDCEEGDYRPNPSFVYIDPYLYRCVAVGVAAGDTATIRLGDPGDRIVAFAMRRGKDGRGRHLRFGKDGTLQTLGNRRAELYFDGTEHEGGAVLTIENGGEDPELVCVGAAQFE